MIRLQPSQTISSVQEETILIITEQIKYINNDKAYHFLLINGYDRNEKNCESSRFRTSKRSKRNHVVEGGFVLFRIETGKSTKFRFTRFVSLPIRNGEPRPGFVSDSKRSQKRAVFRNRFDFPRFELCPTYCASAQVDERWGVQKTVQKRKKKRKKV